MKLSLGIALGALMMLSTEASQPSESELSHMYKAGGNWDDMNRYFEGIERQNGAAHIHFSYHTMATFHGTQSDTIVLDRFFVYNLNVTGCELQLELTDHRSDASMEISFQEVMLQNSCFRNGDEVVFGANVQVRKGAPPPLLFGSVAKISIPDIEAKGVNILNLHLESRHVIVSNDGFFWPTVISTNQFLEYPDCPMDPNVTESLEMAVSHVQYVPADIRSFLPIQFIIEEEPGRGGSDYEVKQFNLQGHQLPDFPVTYGKARLNELYFDGLQIGCAPRQYQYQLIITPYAHLSNVTLFQKPNEEIGFSFSTDRCAAEPLRENVPLFDAGEITVDRLLNDIKDTQIKSLHFITEDKKCEGLIDYNTSESGGISAESLIQQLDCLAPYDIVKLQYSFADICQDKKYWIQARWRIIPGNVYNFAILFKGDRPETFLEQTVELNLRPTTTPAPTSAPTQAPTPEPTSAPASFCDFDHDFRKGNRMSDMKLQLSNAPVFRGGIAKITLSLENLNIPFLDFSTVALVAKSLSVEGCYQELPIPSSYSADAFISQVISAVSFSGLPAMNTCFRDSDSVALTVQIRNFDYGVTCGLFLLPVVYVLDLSTDADGFEVMKQYFKPTENAQKGDFLLSLDSFSSDIRSPSFCRVPEVTDMKLLETPVSLIAFNPRNIENILGMQVDFKSTGNSTTCRLPATTQIFGGGLLNFPIPFACSGIITVLPLVWKDPFDYCYRSESVGAMHGTAITVNGAAKVSAYIDGLGIRID